jgi:hypothetical protein
VVVEIATHADVLRTLTGKEEGWFDVRWGLHRSRW